MRSQSPQIATVALSLILAAFLQASAQERFDRERFNLNRNTESGRSILQVRTLMPDQRRLPRSNARQTHRGWEIRTAQYEVIAPHHELAEQAATEFEKGWRAAEQLARRVGRDTQAFGFAQRRALLLIDAEQKQHPRSNRYFENQNQQVVHIRVAADLNAHHHQAIRKAAFQSFLDASNWNRELPLWFQKGISQWAAKRLSTTNEKSSEVASVATQAESFRSARGSNSQTVSDDMSEFVVGRLLAGNGGEHAWRVFAALRDNTRSITSLEALRVQFDSATRMEDSAIELVSAITSTTAPEVGTTQLRELETDLYVLLRLAERERRANSPLPETNTASRVVVQTFENGKITQTPANSVNAFAKNREDARNADRWRQAVRRRVADGRWSVLLPGFAWADGVESTSVLRRMDHRLAIRFSQGRWTISYPIGGGGEQLAAVWVNPNAAGSKIVFQRRIEAAQPSN